MGLDMFQQAVPDDWHFLARCVGEPSLGYSLVHIRDVLANGPEDLSGPAAIRLAEAGHELLASNPAIGSLSIDLHRKWDLLHYLVSPDRRSGGTGNDLGTSFVHGADPLGDGVESGQGCPIKWNDATVVAQIADWTMNWEPDEVVSAHFVPDDLARAGVYKYVKDRDDEVLRKSAAYLLNGLQRLYWETAERGLGMLVVLW